MAYSPAHLAAYRKGQEAARAGKSREDCPYKATAFTTGKLSRGRGLAIFSQTFRTRWLAGFNSVKKGDDHK